MCKISWRHLSRNKKFESDATKIYFVEFGYMLSKLQDIENYNIKVKKIVKISVFGIQSLSG